MVLEAMAQPYPLNNVLAVPRLPPSASPDADSGLCCSGSVLAATHLEAGSVEEARWTPRPAPPRSALPGTIRFSRPHRAVGTGQHRSGWPYALGTLTPLLSPDGILFDDFVERSFSYDPIRRPYRQPWVGIFHHPPNMPYFTGRGERHVNMFDLPIWQESAKHLRLAIALSRYSEEGLKKLLSVPTTTVYHPTETPRRKWSEKAYLDNPEKELLQIGWYLRNTRAIHQVPALLDHRKVRLRINGQWINGCEQRVRRHWEACQQRREFGLVEERSYVPDDRYDELLSRNVVLTEVFDASANNVVIECLARNTPLIVNRHPALEEYLTTGYPLFFDDINEVPGLLHTDQVLAGHRYLRELDKTPLRGDSFRESIRQALLSRGSWGSGLDF